ncbi:hypothetical protein Drorol1_Dr00000708 [Drosera rotundifolia]
MDQLKPSQPNSSPLTPLSFLERAAVVYNDCPSVVYNDTTYTWSQTFCRCLQVASSIWSLGIKRGDVVSVLAPNIPAMYELQFSVPMAGGILNDINTRLDARTISVVLRHAESRLVFVDHDYCDVLLDAVSRLPHNFPRPILVLITETEYGSINQHHNDKKHPAFIDTYESFLSKGDANFEWIRPQSDWDPIVLNYTSGTTSAPKGVVHCHRGYFINALNAIIDWSFPKQPVYLWTLPMFHGNGWCFTWATAAVGGTNVCLRKFDAPTIYDAIDRHDVTHMCGAPVILSMLCNDITNAKPLKKPVYFLTSGAPPAASVLLKTESLGFIVSHCYGMTETGSHMASCEWKKSWDGLPGPERARLKARQGVRTVCTTAINVLDPASGKNVKPDGKSLGEIVLRGPNLTLGYLKDPKATSKALGEDGWLRTGDIAVIHPDGYLEIKDRKKDVIISGGENISSIEVEAVLYSHEAINEAAVVAQPDEYWGETPCAFVTLKKGVAKKPTEKEIIEYCRKRMPHYMVPKTVIFQNELPKTATGKTQKFVLRKIAAKSTIFPLGAVSRL